MTFNWKSYVYLAELLLKSPLFSGDVDARDEEAQANYRVALSRAYYGLFGNAYNYLRDVEHDNMLQKKLRMDQGEWLPPDEFDELKRETRSIHDYVLRRLAADVHDKRRSGLRKGVRMTLNDLKERRVEADYREGAEFDPRTVKKAVADAKQALSYVSQLCRPSS
jgi:hypothetical protein